jgi:hypothetical protein
MIKIYNVFFDQSLKRIGKKPKTEIYFNAGFKNYTDEQVNKWWEGVQDRPAPRCTVASPFRWEPNESFI